MRVELIDDEDPLSLFIFAYGLFDVSTEILLLACGADTWSDHLTRRDLKVCDQAQRAVALVLELDLLNLPRSDWFVRGDAFSRLDTCLLVRTDDVNALFFQRDRLLVKFADLLRPLSKLRRRFVFVVQPVANLVRLDFGFFLKSERPGARRWMERFRV